MWEWTPPASPSNLPSLLCICQPCFQIPAIPPQRLPHSSSASLHVEGTSAPNQVQPWSVTHSLLSPVLKDITTGIVLLPPRHCFLLSAGLVLSPHTRCSDDRFKGKYLVLTSPSNFYPVFLPCPAAELLGRVCLVSQPPVSHLPH